MPIGMIESSIKEPDDKETNARPWVLPDDVRDYTEKSKVKARSDDKLKIDIARAEAYVIRYTNNHFDDDLYVGVGGHEIPPPVKAAVILIAEMYAGSAVENLGAYKSETLDDYSYTAADTAKQIESLDLGALLDEFVIAAPRNGIDMRLRKL